MGTALSSLALLIFLGLSTTTSAELVTVDVGSYAGDWALGGPFLSGNAVVDLGESASPWTASAAGRARSSGWALRDSRRARSAHEAEDESD